MSPRKNQILWILTVFLLVVVVDQTTKALIIAYYPEEKILRIGPEPEFFRISHQRNPGLVNGLFRESPVKAMVAPILAMGVLAYLSLHLNPRSKLQSTAFGLIAGGAIGNMIDRVRLGSVTDFLQFHFYFIPFNFPWKYYPAFNVADSCICTGVVVLLLTWYFIEEQHVPDTA
ncbi:MAG TPA: signal peptidase II [Candidatus Hydrogenedentes bacterium]|nr:signal peptidase II [Candidatus Hydrogenedentota bacterium]HPC17593.1 signal peptidase II [Candidatus Hydrogenedentota bacterium]HRT21478.1 signal peptidase II [Candidatus Hydrogenedentota bacterium]HRT63918.1 signal peptidase II [Candidatus Hydrogenedentota bacterium]